MFWRRVNKLCEMLCLWERLISSVGKLLRLQEMRQGVIREDFELASGFI